MLAIHAIFRDDYSPNWQITPAHTSNHILLLVTDGQLCYNLDETPVELKKGELLYIPEGTLRSGINHHAGTHQKYSVHFQIEGDSQFPSLYPTNDWRKVQPGNFNYIRQRFLMLFQNWIEKSPGFEIICLGILMEIIGISQQAFSTSYSPSRKIDMVNKVKTYILSHYREQIKMKDLADLVDRTPNYITHVFKDVTSQSPIQYMHYIRIFAARDLIVATDMPLADIAYYLGYCDQAHFNKAFKAVMGNNPSQWRKSRL